MARKKTFDEDLPVDIATDEIAESAPPVLVEEPEPPAELPAAKPNIPILEMAVAAIARFRQNDGYGETNNNSSVQYRNSSLRLVVNVTKSGEKNPVAKAEALLAAYKNFTAAQVLDAKPAADGKFVVVTTNGEKYRYDPKTNSVQ